MLEYEFDGQTFNVHPYQKDNFLQKYPNKKIKSFVQKIRWKYLMA